MNNKYLILILILTICLRFNGLEHGNPFISNQDEPTIVKEALGLRYQFDIDRFDWGHFNFYFMYIIFQIFIKFRGLLNILPFTSNLQLLAPILWQDIFIFYVIARFMTALFGSLTIIPIYLISTKLFGKKSALYSILIFALIPNHIYSSHIANQDVPQLFWIGMSMLFAVYFSKSSQYKNLILSGIFLGIAMGYKYHTFLLIPLLIGYQFISKSTVSQNKNIFDKLYNLIKVCIQPLLAITLVTFTTFFITNFEIFDHFDTFWSYEYGKGFLWQIFENSKIVELNKYPQNIIYSIRLLSTDLSILLLGTFIVGSFYAIYLLIKNNDINYNNLFIALTFIYTVLLFSYLSGSKRVGSRYFIILYINIVILSGYYIKIILSSRYNKVYNMGSHIFVYSLILTILLSAIMNSIIFSRTTTLQIVIKKMIQNKEQYYYESEHIDKTNQELQLGLKEYTKYKNNKMLFSGDIIITDNQLLNVNNARYIGQIDNSLRYGPIFYFYKILDAEKHNK